MPLTGKGRIFLAGIVLLFSTVTVLAFTGPSYYTDGFAIFTRLFALYGFLMVAIAAMLTPFLSRIAPVLGRPFIPVHHAFAITGIVLVTAHPVTVALRLASPAAFIPITSSWIDFWTNAGRVAIYLVYIAIAAAFFRSVSGTHWRAVHGFVYLVLFLAIVHANLIGTDFQNGAVRILYDVIFIGVIAAFIANRVRRRRQNRAVYRPAVPVRGETGESSRVPAVLEK